MVTGTVVKSNDKETELKARIVKQQESDYFDYCGELTIIAKKVESNFVVDPILNNQLNDCTT